MKISKLLFLLAAYMQLASCQTKSESGFVIQDSKLYYDNKEIGLGMPVESFTEAMGMYDRINIDSSGGFTSRRWLWTKKGYDAFYLKDEKKYSFYKNNEESIYNSMEEITSKYGKYDSIEEIKAPIRIQKLFIWDKLGITLAADTGNDKVIGNIHLQTLYPTKFEELDLGLVKNFEEQNGFPLTKEVQEKRKNDKENIQKSPQKEYTGNFTYNGKTINLKDIGYKGWHKGIKGLGIEGSDYDPPGDSSNWSRWIKETTDMYITLERYNNEQEYGELSPDKVGDFDCIRSIVIWNHENYDKKDK